MRTFAKIFTFSVLVSQVSAQTFLPEIAPTFNNSSLKLSCNIFGGKYNSTKDFVDVLALSSDSSVYDAVKDKYAPMKGNISDVYLFQEQGIGAKSDSSVTVFISFDKNTTDPVLGNGGGLVFFKMKRNKITKSWEIVPSKNNSNTKEVYFRNVNLDAVGGSVYNKKIMYAGKAGGNGHRFLLVEDVSAIQSNKDLKGFTDTSDYTYPAQYTQATKDRSVIPSNKTVKRYLAMGFPIEINGLTGEVVGKMPRMGRGVTSMAKYGTSVIYAIGGNPSVLLKYTPNEDIDQSPLLYAPRTGDAVLGGDGDAYISYYKQELDGSGRFIPLNNVLKIDTIPSSDPNNLNGYDLKYNQVFDSLIYIKEKALRAGATMFANIGDVAVTTDQQGNDVVLITEKGIDNSGDLYVKNRWNGTLANHLASLDSVGGSVDGKFSDPYGRVLTLSLPDYNGILSVWAKGGITSGSSSFFSNPDRIEVINTENSTSSAAIIIKENIPAISLNRNPSSVTSFNNRINEAYVVELNDPNGILPYSYNDFGQLYVSPIVPSDLKLFASSAQGSVLSSSGSSFVANSKLGTGKYYDTYLMVENGSQGTDASKLLAVRNLYPTSPNCVDIITAFDNSDDNLNGHALSIFSPNPSNGILKSNRIGNYTLFNLNGEIVKSFNNTDNLDLSDLAKGLYTIKDELGKISKIILY